MVKKNFKFLNCQPSHITGPFENWTSKNSGFGMFPVSLFTTRRVSRLQPLTGMLAPILQDDQMKGIGIALKASVNSAFLVHFTYLLLSAFFQKMHNKQPKTVRRTEWLLTKH